MSSIFKGDGVIQVAKAAGLALGVGAEVGYDPGAGASGEVVVGAGDGIIGRVWRSEDAWDYCEVLLPQQGRRVENFPLGADAAVDDLVDLGGYFGIHLTGGKAGDKVAIAI